MFNFPLLPDFPALRKRILALNSVPEVYLPEDVLEGLVAIQNADPRVLREVRGKGTRALWANTIRSVSRLMVRAGGVSLLAAICAAAGAFLGMQILQGARSLSFLLGLALGFFSVNLLSYVATFASDRLRLYVRLAVESHLVSLVSTKMLRISSRRRIFQSSGNLKILVTSDTKTVADFLDNVVRNLIPSLAALVVMIPLLIHLTGAAGAAGVGFMALIIPVSAGLTRISTRFQELTQTELDRLASLAGEWVKNIRLIRFLGWNRQFERDIAANVRALSRVGGVAHFMLCLIFGMSQSWWMLAVAVVAIVAKLTAVKLDLIGFFGSIWLLTYLSNYFTHLPNTIRLFGTAAPSMERIARFLSEEEQGDFFEPAKAQASELRRKDPVRVRFEDVTFRYGEGAEILRNFSLQLDLREKVALVGEVGSGKTTFLKLLCGDLAPTQGRILVDFDDGSAFSLWEEPVYHRFREGLAYVPQEPFISNDRLSANIALDESSDDSSIMQAVALAELEADLALLSKGLNEEIGENGVNLSGGQKQRVNLARAFYSRRSYLVLDDPLSAVDVRTEVALMETLVASLRGILLVTHRVGELMRMDRVLVLKGGRIVEDGTPSELATRADSHFVRVMSAYANSEVAHVE